MKTSRLFIVQTIYVHDIIYVKSGTNSTAVCVSIIRLSVSKEPQVEIRAMKMSCRLRARFHANILKTYEDREWTATLSNCHFRLFKE